MRARIMIEVRGGVAGVVMATEPVDVVIVDMDNMASGDPPNLHPAAGIPIKTNKEFEEALDGVARIYEEGFKIA